MNDESHHGFHSLCAALCAGTIGPLLDHWLMRYLLCAAIGLAFSLLADWLRPAVARHGRRVAGERTSEQPPSSRSSEKHEIPVEVDDE